MPNGHDALQAIPLPDADWLYGERFLLALTTAAQMHAAQRRKGTDIPYVSHLLGACSIALEYGANEDEAIAALLHDAIEDIRPTADARATVAWFGGRVLHIVEGCTDADVHPKPPWRARKEAHLAYLATADSSVLLVSGADKLHNLRTIRSDIHRVGTSVWDRFNARRDDVLWYYESIVSVMKANKNRPTDLVLELERTVVDVSTVSAVLSKEGIS